MPPLTRRPADLPEPPASTTAARRRPSRRALLIGSIIAVLAAVGLGWLAWELTHPDADTTATGPGRGGPGARGPGGRGAAVTVGVATAESANIPVVLDALGTVVPQATVRVRPQVSGVLQRVHFKEGQMVRKGQLLAEIDPRPFEAALQQAIGARQRNEAQLQAARVTLQRYQTLLAQDSIARQEVDTQAAQVRQLEASLATDRGAEQAARLNVAHTRIVAPIAGRVGLRTVDVGNVVGPGDADGLIVITQLTPIDVEFAVPQDHASWLQHNAGAFMEVQAFDRTRTTLLDTGAFASLDNQIDPQTGTVRAKARFNNARMQLFPSQFVNVKLQLRTIENAVVVPVAAVRQGGSGEYVFVLQPDRTVQLRPVVRGQPLGDRVEIASGLQLGERVITEGADRLRDGSRVTLPGDAPRGPGAREGGPAARQGGAGGREGGRRGGAGGPQPAASAPLTGASAAQAPAVGPGATPPWAPASAMMGAPAGGEEAAQGGRPRAGQGLSAEERAELRRQLESLSPEEREAMRQQRRQRRDSAAPSGGTP